MQPGRPAFFGPLVGGEVILSHIERDFEQNIALRSFGKRSFLVVSGRLVLKGCSC